MKKFHMIVVQAKALFPYKNTMWKRQMYVTVELTQKPSPEVQKEIDEKLKEMNRLTAYQGSDSTPDERYEYRLQCRDLMDEIKLLDYNYYSSIKIQDE